MSKDTPIISQKIYPIRNKQIVQILLGRHTNHFIIIFWAIAQVSCFFVLPLHSPN